MERREFEYIRHGTRSFIISRDVVTGQIVEPYGGPRLSDRVAQRWQLVISEKTAKNYIANIFSKLQVNDRTQAILVALREGLVTLPRDEPG